MRDGDTHLGLGRVVGEIEKDDRVERGGDVQRFRERTSEVPTNRTPVGLGFVLETERGREKLNWLPKMRLHWPFILMRGNLAALNLPGECDSL